MTGFLKLDDLAGFDEARWEHWLSDRLKRAYDANNTETAMEAHSFIEFRIFNTESMGESLKVIFSKLPEHSLDKFHRAIGSVLSQHRPGAFPVNGVRDLITLVATTGAYSQLDAIDVALGSNGWGARYPELFRVAVSAFRSLRGSPRTYASVKRLITSNGFFFAHFPDLYIFDIYEVLVSSAPPNWDTDLSLLSPRMMALEERLATSRDPVQMENFYRRCARMYEHILRTVSGSDLLNGIERLLVGLPPFADPVGRFFVLITHRLDLTWHLAYDTVGRLVLNGKNSELTLPLGNLSAKEEQYLSLLLSDSDQIRHRRELDSWFLIESEGENADFHKAFAEACGNLAELRGLPVLVVQNHGYGGSP